jgi:predicted nucleotide-binding protein (sugar kinase/HSP70/actin superfamily)
MVFPLLTHIVGTRAHLHLALDENVGLAGFKTRCAAFRRLLDEKSAVPQSPRASRPDGFQAPRYPKKTRGVVWVSLHVGAFYGAAFESIGWKTRFLPEDHPEVMERGQKYFSKGEPCLPFVQLAGALELMTQDPTFDPQNDVLHVPGTRHCASATLPHLCRNVLTQLGHPNLPIVSPREGMDMAEGVETFGIKFTRNLLRAMVAGEYLKKLRTSIRPYEIRTGETDRVYEACRKELYESFAKNRSFFGTVKKMIAVMTAIPTKNKGSRPQVLITGEYVVRTNPVLNLEIHRKIEALGGEAIYTPIFTDYAEMAARSRAANFWRLGMKFKALREKLFCTFSVHDCIRLKKLFAPHLPGQIEPNPLIGMADCAKEINSAADPMLRLELAQAGWPMKHGNIAGIINVSPFGCSVSTSVEPLLHKLFGDRVPVLGLAFDGQAGVHSDNRLAAFMECVRGRKSELPATSVKEQGMVVAALHQGA